MGQSTLKINEEELDLFVEVEASTPFEKLPKIILNEIFSHLNISELIKISSTNKFLFNLIFNKQNLSSKMIWLSKYKEYMEEEILNEDSIDQFINEREWSKYQSNFNPFYLAFKYNLGFENLDDPSIQSQFEGNKYTITYTGKKKKSIFLILLILC